MNWRRLDFARGHREWAVREFEAGRERVGRNGLGDPEQRGLKRELRAAPIRTGGGGSVCPSPGASGAAYITPAWPGRAGFSQLGSGCQKNEKNGPEGTPPPWRIGGRRPGREARQAGMRVCAYVLCVCGVWRVCIVCVCGVCGVYVWCVLCSVCSVYVW